jgi:hypothetical protein
LLSRSFRRPLALPCPHTGNQQSELDSLSALNDICAGANKKTYLVVATGYTAYTTPTDLICLSGSATKTVSISQMYIGIQSTAAALQTVYFIKRSTANSGGTSTTLTPLTYDSSNAAATGVVTVYTAAPSVGSVVGNVRILLVASGVLTGAPGILSLNAQALAPATFTTFSSPVILRGMAESLCINYNGAALTSGFSAVYGVEWIEY